MVCTHADVLPKHLGTVSPLVQGREHFDPVAPGTFFKRIPLVHSSPLGGKACDSYVVRVLNMYHRLLKLRIEGMPLKLRSQERFHIPAPFVSGIATRAVNTNKSAAIFDIAAECLLLA